LRAHKLTALALLLFAFSGAPAQQPAPTETPKPALMPSAVPEEPPVVTGHELRVGGKVLKYNVTTGLMPLKSATGETEARMFYMAYTLEREGPAAQRPLLFSFNGGPGSASVWLHLGALGPQRVRMQTDGMMPAPPFQLVDNEQTWLDKTDLVFIDPVGTGYSRAVRPELAAKFFSLDGDLNSVGEFIRIYLTRNQRWPSPLFLAGESYGTTRAAGLAGLLVDKGIVFNGVLLISTVLNFQTLLFGQGNDLPYQLIYPSYTATAWYHKKLPADLQAKPLRAVLDEAEKWMSNDLTLALAKGDSLPPAERAAVIDKLARYTGLSRQFIDNNNLRIELGHFNKELLRDEKRTTGRLDSRFKGIDATAGDDQPGFDPSMAAIRAPYTAMLNDYVRGQLGYKTDAEYYILGGGITAPWNFGANNAYADTSNALRNAFAKNPFMKVFVAFGYYDLATPFAAAQYTLDHSNLDATHRAQITRAYYEAGHMMYIDQKSLVKLKQDVDKFIDSAWK
jgi:carboxypeptidase C (cathepsin A)